MLTTTSVCHAHDLDLSAYALKSDVGAGALPGIYDIRSYGALSDGKTLVDDTSAIQKAVDAAGAHRGGTVWIAWESGLSAPLAIPSFVRLTGPGHPWHTSELGAYGDPAAYYGGGLVAMGSLDFHMLVNADQTHGNTGIEVDHLRIDQRGVTGDRDALRFDLLWRSSFHDLSIVGAATTNKRGIHVLSGEEIRIKANRLDGCGIRYVGNAGSVRENDIGAFGVRGVDLANGFGNVVNENHIYNASQFGIYGANQYGAQFIGNRIEDCQYDGMYFANKLVNATIVGNILNQNSRIGAGQAYGLRIDSDTPASASTGNTVSANQCIDGQASPTQLVGIALVSYSGTQTNGNLVTGNHSRGGVFQKAGLSNTVSGNI